VPITPTITALVALIRGRVHTSKLALDCVNFLVVLSFGLHGLHLEFRHLFFFGPHAYLHDPCQVLWGLGYSDDSGFKVITEAVEDVLEEFLLESCPVISFCFVGIRHVKILLVQGCGQPLHKFNHPLGGFLALLELCQPSYAGSQGAAGYKALFNSLLEPVFTSPGRELES
jgi:hypothetical protein